MRSAVKCRRPSGPRSKFGAVGADAKTIVADLPTLTESETIVADPKRLVLTVTTIKCKSKYVASA
jgi:hypothetical protein